MSCVLMAVFVGSSGCRSDGPTVTVFDTLPDDLPYEVAPPIQTVRSGVTVPRTHQLNAIVLDLDGDGDEDYLIATEERVRRLDNRGDTVVHDRSMPLEPGYGFDGNLAIHEPLDLDRDGLPEISISGPSSEGDVWRIWILDPHEWQLIDTLVFPTPDGARQDGRWDGSYALQGVIEVPTESGSRRAYLISVTAGYDRGPRGIIALDCQTHEVLWQVLAGPKVLHRGVVIRDFDGDGRQEIFYTCGGVGNVTAAEGNGYADDHSILFALNTDGTRIWERKLAREPSGASVWAVDLEGDGREELLLTYRSDGEDSSAIEVVDPGNGDAVASWSGAAGVRFLAFLRVDGRVDIVATTQAKGLVRLEYRDGVLLERARAQFKSTINVLGCGDLIGSGEPQVFVQLAAVEFLAIDASLTTVLARRKIDDSFPCPSFFLPWRVFGRNHGMLIGAKEFRNDPIVLDPVEREAPEGLIGFVAGAIAAVAISLLLVWLWWRRHRDRAAVSPDGLQPKRDLQLRLLDDLAAASHGRIGALTKARSVVRLSDLSVGGHLNDASLLSKRSREFQSDCWPHVAEILDRCEAAGQSLDEVAVAREAFGRMLDIVARMEADGHAEASVSAEIPALKKAWKRGESAVKTIRRNLEIQFSTDLGASLEHVLELYNDALAGTEVAVQGAGGMHLRIHIDDLEFVLDNLVGNAVRAMRKSSERTLTITVSRADGAGHCTVADSGEGMPPEVVAKLGQERVSSRRGGGFGWLNSVVMLKRYGASLQVLTDDPGPGTRVLLSVPLTAEPETDGVDDDD